MLKNITLSNAGLQWEESKPWGAGPGLTNAGWIGLSGTFSELNANVGIQAAVSVAHLAADSDRLAQLGDRMAQRSPCCGTTWWLLGKAASGSLSAFRFAGHVTFITGMAYLSSGTYDYADFPGATIDRFWNYYTGMHLGLNFLGQTVRSYFSAGKTAEADMIFGSLIKDGIPLRPYARDLRDSLARLSHLFGEFRKGGGESVRSFFASSPQAKKMIIHMLQVVEFKKKKTCRSALPNASGSDFRTWLRPRHKKVKTMLKSYAALSAAGTKDSQTRHLRTLWKALAPVLSDRSVGAMKGHVRARAAQRLARSHTHSRPAAVSSVADIARESVNRRPRNRCIHFSVQMTLNLLFLGLLYALTAWQATNQSGFHGA